MVYDVRYHQKRVAGIGKRGFGYHLGNITKLSVKKKSLVLKLIQRESLVLKLIHTFVAQPTGLRRI